MIQNENNMSAQIVQIYISLLFVTSTFAVSTGNLTCYQCIRKSEKECGPEDLLPCPSSSDRCVTYIKKTEKDGFSIKRECGLGPCSFDDDMVNRGLGMDISCNRKKNEYMCLFCCTENGCNKNSSSKLQPNKTLVCFIIAVICIFNIIKDFIPPFNGDK